MLVDASKQDVMYLGKDVAQVDQLGAVFWQVHGLDDSVKVLQSFMLQDVVRVVFHSLVLLVYRSEESCYFANNLDFILADGVDHSSFHKGRKLFTKVFNSFFISCKVLVFVRHLSLDDLQKRCAFLHEISRFLEALQSAYLLRLMKASKCLFDHLHTST